MTRRWRGVALAAVLVLLALLASAAGILLWGPADIGQRICAAAERGAQDKAGGVSGPLVGACWRAGSWVAEGAAEPAQADAIVVLGANGVERIAEGARLYREGYAPVLVLLNSDLWRPLRLGVPRRSVIPLDGPGSTLEEAQAVADLMRQRDWHHVLVVSDPPHMRRLRLLWDAAFTGTGLAYTAVASRPAWWADGAWWRYGHAAQFLQRELRLLPLEGLAVRLGLRGP